MKAKRATKKRKESKHGVETLWLGLDSEVQFIYVLERDGMILFWQLHPACGILVPQPGMKLMPTTVEVRSLNHWTAREVPKLLVL